LGGRELELILIDGGRGFGGDGGWEGKEGG